MADAFDEFIISRHADHSRVIRTVNRGRTVKADALPFAGLFQRCPQVGIGRYAAGYGLLADLAGIIAAIAVSYLFFH